MNIVISYGDFIDFDNKSSAISSALDASHSILSSDYAVGTHCNARKLWGLVAIFHSLLQVYFASYVLVVSQQTKTYTQVCPKGKTNKFKNLR